jgi:hypothetical protein
MADHILDEKVRDRDIHNIIEGHRPLATVKLRGPMGDVIANDTPQDIAFWKNKGCKIIEHIPPNASGTSIETTPGDDEGDDEGEGKGGE